MMRLGVSLALALLAATPAVAQTAPAAVAATPDPARLAAAHALIDLLMPPAQRERMIEQMMTPMLANMRRGMSESPTFVALFANDPKGKQLLDSFFDRLTKRSLEDLRAQIPAMGDVMAAAYARRFDLKQLGEIRAFYETPTGQAYRDAALSIMSDPDVAQWQRDLMTRSLSHLQQDLADFAADIQRSQEKKQ